MAAKAVVRDVGRVLGHPYGFVDRIAKLIPADPGMTLAKALEKEPELPELYEQDEEVTRTSSTWRAALEGVDAQRRQTRRWRGDRPTKLTDFAPLYCDDSGTGPVTQFDKNDVEYAGLVKFDFLGLRTLTIIDWALGMINARRAKRGQAAGRHRRCRWIDDKKSFALLQRFETTAVFQLESRGMKDLIKRLQPDCFEDMIAAGGAVPPGPAAVRHGRRLHRAQARPEAISYRLPGSTRASKPVLEPTYGVILYQEQVMQIAQVLAGYTLGGADLLRRAMGKKKPEEMAKQRRLRRGRGQERRRRRAGR
jgi:DNA polymerase-3 subunit alpha